MTDLVNSYLLAPLGTIAIELLVAALYGFREKREFIIVAAMNVLTNPILNYLLWINLYYEVLKSNLILVLALELLVIIVEWKLLEYALKEKSNKLLLLSALMNLSSFISGILIFG